MSTLAFSPLDALGRWIETAQELSNLSGQSRVVFLPVETITRELDSRLLVALELSNRGYFVLVGNPGYLTEIAAALKGGVFFDKDFGDHNPRHALLASETLRTCAIDEEGVNFISEDHYFYWRHLEGKKTLSSTSAIMAWGQAQYDMLSHWAGSQVEKVVMTGSARLDLLSPEFEEFYSEDVASLRMAYSKFVLVATSLPAGNYAEFYELDFVAHMERTGLGLSEEKKIFLQEMADHQRKQLESFTQLLLTLSAQFPDSNFVVRPHPSESLLSWRRRLGHLRNVHITREGSVVPWILASTALIHSGSTTGIEAFMLGKPVMSFGPKKESVFEDSLVNSLGVRVSSPDEAVTALRKVFGGLQLVAETEFIRQQNSLRPYVNPAGENLAFVKIADLISDLHRMIPSFSRKSSSVLRALRGFRIKAVVRLMFRRSPVMSALVSAKFRAKLRNTGEKFQELTAGQVESRISRLLSARRNLAWNAPIIKSVGVDVVLIAPSRQEGSLVAENDLNR